jgi:hypothetical protein
MKKRADDKAASEQQEAKRMIEMKKEDARRHSEGDTPWMVLREQFAKDAPPALKRWVRDRVNEHARVIRNEGEDPDREALIE